MKQSRRTLRSKPKQPWQSASLIYVCLCSLIAILTIGVNLAVLALPTQAPAAASAKSSSVRTLDRSAQAKEHITAKEAVETPSERQQQQAETDELDEDEDPDEEEDSEPAYVEQRTLPPMSLEDGQSQILEIFKDAGVTLDDETLSSLPTWDDIRRNIGDAPKIYGLEEHCHTFRELIPAVERNIACCGMFNSGTNLVTRLLKENCKIPERIEYYGMDPDFDKWGMGPGDAHGMRWQVPWGKHTAAKYREVHATEKASNISKASVLPVATIRHPYNWMLSMCNNRYTAKWQHGRKCPHLVRDFKTMKSVNLTVEYGSHHDEFDSLAHLWNGWYEQYWKDAAYPRLIVRFEDLIFHARNVTTQICHCAGGIIRTDRPFFHIVQSAKQGPGHGSQEKRTGMVQAWIKYGQALPFRGTFTKADYRAARQFLNQDLMKVFGYKHPGPKPPYEEE